MQSSVYPNEILGQRQLSYSVGRAALAILMNFNGYFKRFYVLDLLNCDQHNHLNNIESNSVDYNM